MHELGLCRRILEIVEQNMQQRPHALIKKIILEVGHLVALDKASLKFCFDAAAEETIAQHAVLEIVEIPGTALCGVCHNIFSLPAYGDGCSFCGSYQYQILQGEECNLKSMVVE